MKISLEKKNHIEVLLKPFRYLYYFVLCFNIFKKPLSVIYHYIRKIPPREKIVELRNGIKIFLSDHPHDIITIFVVFVKKDYGKINRGSVVIDIGGNIGIFSLYAAYCGAIKIYAFEPNREANEVFKRNIINNNLENIINLENLAVSEIEGEKINIPIKSSPYNKAIRDNDFDGYEQVETVTIEGILEKESLNFVDLLKIDCEGMEYDIFKNIKENTLKKFENIRLEFHPGPLKELISFLEKNQFKMICLKLDSSVLWVRKSNI